MNIKLRAQLALTNLVNARWWKDAGLRAAYSAVAIALPYFASTQLVADVTWLTVASAAVLGALASLATSLAGLPEVEGVDLPWWLAATERVVKTLGQALAAGLLGAVLITDVQWGVVLQASAMAALVSLLRLILATLPADPSRAPIDAGGATPGTVMNISSIAPHAAAEIDADPHNPAAFPHAGAHNQ